MLKRSWIRMFLTAATAALCLGACATPYAARVDGSLGYDSHYVDDGIYYVEFAYNGFTSDGQAQESFERRCAEVCSEDGFPDHEIIESSPSEERLDTLAAVTTTPYRGGHSSTTLVPSSGSIFKITGHVRCLTAQASAKAASPLGQVVDPEDDEAE
jgi:hypothetical protein